MTTTASSFSASAAAHTASLVQALQAFILPSEIQAEGMYIHLPFSLSVLPLPPQHSYILILWQGSQGYWLYQGRLPRLIAYLRRYYHFNHPSNTCIQPLQEGETELCGSLPNDAFMAGPATGQAA